MYINMYQDKYRHHFKSDHVVVAAAEVVFWSELSSVEAVCPHIPMTDTHIHTFSVKIVQRKWDTYFFKKKTGPYYFVFR